MKHHDDTDSRQLDLSVILPIYNERDNLVPLIEEIRAAIPDDRSYEILCVDDASTDGSTTLLAELATTIPQVRHLRHVGNFGQSAAIRTGMTNARGEILITMDSDRQNVPEDIPVFLAAMDSETACVCGIRQKRKDSWLKLQSSRYANKLRRMLLGDTIQDAGCGFRAIRRTSIGDLPAFNGLHRFIPILLHHQGLIIKEVPIGHRPRTEGVSKYGFHNRFWRGILDCFGVWWLNRRAFKHDRTAPEERT